MEPLPFEGKGRVFESRRRANEIKRLCKPDANRKLTKNLPTKRPYWRVIGGDVVTTRRPTAEP